MGPGKTYDLRAQHLSVGLRVTTVDGSEFRRSPVEVGSLSHYLQSFIHPRWCRISSINSSKWSFQGAPWWKPGFSLWYKVSRWAVPVIPGPYPLKRHPLMNLHFWVWNGWCVREIWWRGWKNPFMSRYSTNGFLRAIVHQPVFFVCSSMFHSFSMPTIFFGRMTGKVWSHHFLRCFSVTKSQWIPQPNNFSACLLVIDDLVI